MTDTADVLLVHGGTPLKGEIRVRGAKNLVPKAMVAALLGETVSVLRDVPDISDVQVVRSLLEVHGVTVKEGEEAGSLVFDPSGAVSAHFEEIDAHAGASRIPILFCGPLLHLLGEALIPDLGGCRIGDRPINFHMDALRAFGAIVDKTYEGIRITAPNGLTGAKIELATAAVVRTASAEDYTAGQRLYGNVEGDLLWTFDKAAGGHPLQNHQWGRLQRTRA